MKAGTLILGGLVIGGGLFLANAVAKASAADRLSYEFAGASLQRSNSNPLSLRILVRLRIVNPTREALVFDSFSGQILLGGRPSGSFLIKSETGKDFIIKPEAKTDVLFPLTVSSLEIVNQLLGIVLNKGKLPTCQLEGTLKAGPFSIPVNEVFELGGQVS